MDSDRTLAVAAFASFAAGALVAVPLYRKWSDSKGKADAYSGLNRTTSGPRSDEKLPVGKHALQLYSLGTPNGIKVNLLLMELLELQKKGKINFDIELDFDAHYIDIGKGDQFKKGFVDINPNSKIPALLDRKGPGGKEIRLFESGAILLYLAEKAEGSFIPKDPATKAEMMNWLMWQMGSAPYMGNFGHFFKYYKRKLPYPIHRFKMETQRLLDVLDKQLEGKDYVVGSEYTLADMAIYPWVRCLSVGYNASKELELDSYKNVIKWMEKIEARPMTEIGLKINGFSAEEKYKNYSSK